MLFEQLKRLPPYITVTFSTAPEIETVFAEVRNTTINTAFDIAVDFEPSAYSLDPERELCLGINTGVQMLNASFEDNKKGVLGCSVDFVDRTCGKCDRRRGECVGAAMRKLIMRKEERK